MEALATYTQPFLAWLLETTLTASMVICLILAAQKLLGRRLGPRWCHALWLVLLIRMVLPWAPPSRISLLNLLPPSVRQTQLQPLSGSAGAPGGMRPTEVSQTNKAMGAKKPHAAGTSPRQTAPRPETLTPAQRPSKSAFAAHHLFLLLLWLAGATVIGIYLLASNFALWRMVRRERPLVSQPTLELFEECKIQMGVSTMVAVVPSDRIRSPALFGFLRPRLLLPQKMLETVRREEMRYVFLHELAHLKRRDIYLGWLTSLLQILHWFNPLVWLAFHRMRADRELACDALVLTSMRRDESQEYGRAILSLLRRFSHSRSLPAMAGILESRSQLKRRIAMIARFKNNSYRWSPLAMILMVVLACVALPSAENTKAVVISTPEPQAVSEAAAPLAGTSSDRDVQKTGIVIQELDIWYNRGGFSLSPDGSNLVICRKKGEVTNLVIRNLLSGQEKQLTHYEAGYAHIPFFSPDGRAVVHTHWQKDGATPLHIVSVETGEDRPLGQKGFVSDWSPDGRFIAVFSGSLRERNTHSILTINADTVEKVDLSLPPGKQQYSDMRFSADGKYVSYARGGNLYLYPIRGGDEIQITDGSNDDQDPLWSPDDKALVFLSRRAYDPELDLCIVPIGEDMSGGRVKVLKPDLGDGIYLCSLSNTGRLLYEQTNEERSIWLAAVDSQTGQPTEEPRRLATGTEAMWSPDGQRVAYVAEGVLHVISADGGNDQEIMKVYCHGTDTYAWAADNDHIYMVEYTDSKRGIYAISLSTEERRPILEDQSVHHLTCSPDGKQLAFMKSPSSGGKSQVFTADVDGGNLRQLTSGETSNKYYPMWSPDGKWIAFERYKNAHGRIG